jgi:hypothetical protein
MASQQRRVEAFARLLLESCVLVHVRENPWHDAPGWETLPPHCRRPYEALAAELLRRGVKPPEA